MRLFYDPQISGDFHVLNEEESKHCTKVLRLSKGDEIYLTDGKGNMYRTEILEIHQKKTVLKIIEIIADYGKRAYLIHIAIAPTKNNDRFEWFVEKTTEIGIDEISPIICKNSERKFIKLDRLNRIAEAAMKQSQKAYHPKINEQVDFAKFILQSFDYDQKFIAHCEDDLDKNYLGNLINKNESVIILIGPEGDFNSDEIQMAKNAGFVPISLGDSRLRTETAGVVACDICSVINKIN
ncbi:MAG: 16S rRNA (uracil(1498)-N(3))-methyltransferase [Bacteroidales bacterium]|nr:16S rRNA (uracil(1498)-N(3))-methyltransferase [Bacteroidales bacterium]MDY0141544.1 16S rRNA (uracil(1498)-N(3))-methyltransferase [Bacteroidales bacterium]